MAALVVQSRFAGLKIEDDDFTPTVSQKSKRSKTATAKKAELPKKTKVNQKIQTAPKKKKLKQHNPSSDQWDMWKQKDEEMVDGNFENELEQAILLSKLDYEEKKDVYKRIKKDPEVHKKSNDMNTRSGNKKMKKKTVMSLEQFNDMVSGGDETQKLKHEEFTNSLAQEEIPTKDTQFFVRVDEDVKNELIKDKINDQVRHRLSASDEVITRIQYLDNLEKKDKQIAVLEQEIAKIRKELFTVKYRNKKLCYILGQGEMKDKAEVLIELERLKSVQIELTTEISTLHTDLEKERSKNAQDPRAKDKKKKGASTDKDK